ncbi:MAG: hypothetical protein MK098_15415 [Marinovum sp.]|nr:hypothetical protein [Marinovum sp.]
MTTLVQMQSQPDALLAFLRPHAGEDNAKLGRALIEECRRGNGCYAPTHLPRREQAPLAQGLEDEITILGITVRGQGHAALGLAFRNAASRIIGRSGMALLVQHGLQRDNFKPSEAHHSDISPVAGTAYAQAAAQIEDLVKALGQGVVHDLMQLAIERAVAHEDEKRSLDFAARSILRSAHNRGGAA